MKKFSLLISITLLSLLLGATASQTAAQSSERSATVTLFSPNKHPGERRKPCVRLGPAPRPDATCDLYYGMLYAGDELDWFQPSMTRDDRTVIKDLGLLSWTD